MGMHWAMTAVNHQAFTELVGTYGRPDFPSAEGYQDLVELGLEEELHGELLPPENGLNAACVQRLADAAPQSEMLRRLDRATLCSPGPRPFRDGLCYYAPGEAADLLLDLHGLRPTVATWEAWWPPFFESDFVERVAAAATTRRGLLLEYM